MRQLVATPCILSLCLFLSSLEGAEKPEQALDGLIDKLKASPSSLTTVLGEYNRIESADRFDLFGRHHIHQGLLKQVKSLKAPEVARAAAAAFRDSSRTMFPSQVLLMKALLSPDFPAPRKERVDWLLKLAKDKDARRSGWGVHILAESRWPEAIDGLIDLLKKEEVANPQGLLVSVIGADLYHVLGVAGRGTSFEIEKNWNDLGKKAPAKPDHGTGRATGVTVVFFGDRVSPFSAFAIDTSSSMLEKATLRQHGSGGTTGVKGQETSGPKTPKVDIVKQELTRVVGGLQSHCKFNILGYNASYVPWRNGRGGLRLHAASTSVIESASEFVRGLRVAQGTNIHDTMVAALGIPEVETIYLLSDGVPSRGGGPAEIERRVAAMNYLSGIRIVTYGFTPEGGGSFDEAFMRRLALENWGWYRRLN